MPKASVQINLHFGAKEDADVEPPEALYVKVLPTKTEQYP